YKTLPTVFIPNAFTPNNDNLNDLLRPVATGINKIEYFNIYNRWGQQVFSTTVNGKGWDGKINGKEQPAQTYIWIVKAVDFKGQAYFERGTVNLIR
ncbi:MAG: T9SS type B sorting domain-containing protein, partial [Flavisolibacter sp.]